MIRELGDWTVDSEAAPDFAPGDLVSHRRYGYRAVVVEVDPQCRASEAWYQKNATQPKRDQPWYHLLVDQSASITYAAQSSLEMDTQGTPVEHPLLALFFSGFQDGQHLRNNHPWPGDPG